MSGFPKSFFDKSKPKISIAELESLMVFRKEYEDGGLYFGMAVEKETHFKGITIADSSGNIHSNQAIRYVDKRRTEYILSYLKGLEKKFKHQSGRGEKVYKAIDDEIARIKNQKGEVF